MNYYSLLLTIKEFEILEDVLENIEEYRTCSNEDSEALESLKEKFSFEKYINFRDSQGDIK